MNDVKVKQYSIDFVARDEGEAERLEKRILDAMVACNIPVAGIQFIEDLTSVYEQQYPDILEMFEKSKEKEELNEDKIFSDYLKLQKSGGKENKQLKAITPKNANMSDVFRYLKEQKDLCIDQTGSEPELADIIGHVQSKEFRDKFGTGITVGSILNYAIG